MGYPPKRCSKCRGLCVWEEFISLHPQDIEGRFWGWRCMNCGDITDEVILQNRGWYNGKAISQII